MRSKSNLNHFFWYLVNEGYLVVNPMNHVKFSRKYTPSKSRVILSQIDVMDMLDKMKDHGPTIVYPFIYCLAHSGARREEIRTLKWQDIDFENSFIYLPQTKNGEDRAIKMGSSLAAFMDSLTRKNEYIFLNQVETLLSREQIDDTIASLQRKHPSMKRWRCHDLEAFLCLQLSQKRRRNVRVKSDPWA